ncbi:cytochrome c maturation protein CcmE [Candidatus Desantisbacteria bacterium]|nr:cytochrome c maturation protein CcmE [Candidatus Desantisbacteria bacterium]
MTTKTKKILIGSIIVFGILGYLAYSGMQDSMVYYLNVGEFLNDEQKYKNEGVRISGKVVDGSVVRDSNGMRIQFEIMDEKDKNKKIKVDYSGIIPDIFKPDITVVVEGKLIENHVFKATVLLAKCPSKYQEKNEKGTTEKN